MVNYIPINKFSLWRKHFYYADSLTKTANEVFASHGLKVRGTSNIVSPCSEYRVVKCSVRKKDVELFRKCMEELVRVMLLTDRSDYCAFCLVFEDALGGTSNE